MNSRAIPKLALWLVAGVLVAGASGTAATLSACGDAPSCGSLRTQEYNELLTWQACDPKAADQSAECTIFPGSPMDCTGVLACPAMAINPHYRTDFETAVLNAASGSKGCYTCNAPSCLSGTIAVCEEVSRRCIVVSSVASDASTPTPTGTTPTQDAAPADAAAADVSNE